jgi:phosphate starvation-inducible PhoH-like protein
MEEEIINIDESIDINELLGAHDRYLKIIEGNLDIEVYARGEKIQILGEDARVAKLAINALIALLKRGIKINVSDVMIAVKMALDGEIDKFTAMYEEALIKDAQGKEIRTKTQGQKDYVDAIEESDVVFGIGAAGTGKTFLAITMAVRALKKGEVHRIILTRPAVEAGENLGFLPGDLKEKVDPYLRPVYDALHAIMGKEQTERLVDRGIIEIAPLAYMRGRTLDDAFVVLDEAQNTTGMQMKMFLTRLGFNSKMVINGDITQIDLPIKTTSGLVDAKHKLQNIKRIKFIEFTAEDVVRHPIVAKILGAYEKSGD